MATFEYIIVESKGAVGIITLNRPKMLNALSFGVFREIAAAVDDLEADDGIGCILLTGSEKAFAAGADIKEMQPKTFIDMFSSDFAAIGGDRVARCRKPTIAAADEERRTSPAPSSETAAAEAILRAGGWQVISIDAATPLAVAWQRLPRYGSYAPPVSPNGRDAQRDLGAQNDLGALPR